MSFSCGRKGGRKSCQLDNGHHPLWKLHEAFITVLCGSNMDIYEHCGGELVAIRQDLIKCYVPVTQEISVTKELPWTSLF